MKVFDRWARLVEEAPAERAHAGFVGELRALGLLGGEDGGEAFLRIMTQLAVQHCLRSEAAALAATPPGAPRPAGLSFVAVDACVRLMVCLVTQHGGGPALFSRVLGLLATTLQRDAEERGGSFNGRPYFRMVCGFIAELAPGEAAGGGGDEGGMQYLLAVAAFLHATRALRVPAFAFPWLQLVADRRLMPKLLGAPASRGWAAYLQLILAQLRFLEPFLRNAELTDAVRLLYKGTLRVLLVLLHDFPDFLCHFHFHLCDAIPPSCIQVCVWGGRGRWERGRVVSCRRCKCIWGVLVLTVLSPAVPPSTPPPAPPPAPSDAQPGAVCVPARDAPPRPLHP